MKRVVSVYVRAGASSGSEELVFSQETLIVAGVFISNGPIELGEIVVELVFGAGVSLPICLEDVVVSSPVR